jgi:hypothetical protein
MSPPPRPGSTATTVPPDDPPARLARHLGNWKAIVMVGAALVGAGAAVVSYDNGVAKKADVVSERSFAGAIAHDVLELDKRVTHQEERGEWRDAVLTAIANKVGAIVPPLPPPAVP